MLMLLAGQTAMFADAASVIFILLFMYACTTIAFGPKGLVKSILGLRYLFTQKIIPSPASNLLAIIFRKQIYFIYGSALVGVLIGSVAIHANIDTYEDFVFHRAYAVNLLVLFYAAVVAEGILRPLATKFEMANINEQLSDS